MASFDIKLLGQKVHLGSTILISLRSGREIEGTLLEIGEDYIFIKKKNGGEATFLLELLVGWETLELNPIEATVNSSDNGNGHIKEIIIEKTITSSANSFEDISQDSVVFVSEIVETPSVVETPMEKLDALSKTIEETEEMVEQKLPTQSELPQPDLKEKPDISFEVIEKVIEIDMRFKIETQKKLMTPLPLILKAPENEFQYLSKQRINTSFNRLRSIWHTAHTLKEISRLESLISEWSKLSFDFPEIGVFPFNLGCIYFELERFGESQQAFQQATLEDHIESFYNLAVVSLKNDDLNIACYALCELFRRKSAKEYPTIWKLYIGLSLECKTFRSIMEVLNFQANLLNRKEITEAGIFLLKNLKISSLNEFAKYFLETTEVPLIEIIPKLTSCLPTHDDQVFLEEINKFVTAKPTIFRQQTQESSIKIITPEPKPSFSEPVKPIRKVFSENSSYQKAKRAEIERKDYETAEILYYQEINTKAEKWETACKDLALLLNQQGRTNEAVNLIFQHLNEVKEKRAMRNLLVTVYQKAGKYEEAINQLKILAQDAPLDKQMGIQKQIAFCYLKTENYLAAQNVLRDFLKKEPNDLIAQRWFEAIKVGEKIGSDLAPWGKTKVILTDFETSLSDFSMFYLERCKYEGANLNKLDTKNNALKEVDILSNKAEDMGTESPQIRAQILLSAAKILNDVGEGRELQFKKMLRGFCAAMGDQAVREGKLDVARAYYAEAFLVAPEWLRQLEIKLSQFVMSYYATAGDLRNPKIPSIQDCLRNAFSHEGLDIKITKELLYLSVVCKEVAEYLLPKVFEASDLREKVISSCYTILEESQKDVKEVQTKDELIQLWQRGREWARQREQILFDELKVFQQNTTPSLDSVIEVKNRLTLLKEKLFIDTDKNRGSEISDILGLMIDYNRQTTPNEKDYLATIVKNSFSNMLKKLEESPTKISLEIFHPYIQSLASFFDLQYEKFQEATEPDISVELAGDEYYLDDTSYIDCQLLLSNEEGKSPASNVTITIKPSPNEEYYVDKETIELLGNLGGDSSETCEIRIHIKPKARKEKVITFYYSISYETRSGKKIELGNLSDTVSLYPSSEFQYFDDPYQAYASGRPIDIDDYTMFFGRETLVNKLSDLLQFSQHNLGIAIYGQYRSGKTSVLHKVKRKLSPPVIPIFLTIGNIVTDIEVVGLAAFFDSLISGVDNEVAQSLEVSRPSLSEIKELPQKTFIEYLEKVKKAYFAKNHEEVRIVFMLDEVGKLFNSILQGKITGNFMQVWKAMLESNSVSCVIAGPDAIWRFMDRYANEFQVWKPERITYLSKDEARNLIEEPIRISGQKKSESSRFRGAAGKAAIRRLIDLTAGNPFYLQRFCSNLVELMNFKKSLYATDAHVNEVKKQAISTWSKSDFHGLLNSGEEDGGQIPVEDTWNVLREIALQSKNQGSCPISSVKIPVSISLKNVLEDLDRRDVIEKLPNGFLKIKVGLFKEWLIAHEYEVG